MKIDFTFRNLEPSLGMKNYARAKVAKVQKYLRSPLEADVVFSMEGHRHCVELSIRADGDRFAGHVESDDMYASIDLVLDKVNRQIRDAKDAATTLSRSSGGISQLSGKHGPVPEHS